MELKVSIIIPAHNSAGTIEETLESVLKQTFKDWEAVIVNDGSSDNTEEIISRFLNKDKRFRYVKQEKSGVSAARNNGIDNASNEWLLFLDADDLIKQDMLEKMIKGAQLHPECDLILCNWERLTTDRKTIKEIGPNWAAVDAFHLFSVTCAFCIHSCMVKKSAVIKVGKFDRSLTTCEDWDLWQRIARTGAKFTLITDSLAVYRMRSESASNKGIQLFKDGMTVVQRGHSRDSRVKEPDEKYINGTSTPDLQNTINGLFTW
ncbi:MAG TPA: glycosyltransferase, partial [Ignavibacteriaceae bacterium]|nr:glycosyltransferase [Ignavibacteriaceae bacterium]